MLTTCPTAGLHVLSRKGIRWCIWETAILATAPRKICSSLPRTNWCLLKFHLPVTNFNASSPEKYPFKLILSVDFLVNQLLPFPGEDFKRTKNTGQNRRARCSEGQQGINQCSDFMSGQLLVFQMGRPRPQQVTCPRQGPPTGEARTEPPPPSSSSYLPSPKHIEAFKEVCQWDRVFLFNVQNSTCTLKESYLGASLVNRLELWCQGSELIAMRA